MKKELSIDELLELDDELESLDTLLDNVSLDLQQINNKTIKKSLRKIQKLAKAELKKVNKLIGYEGQKRLTQFYQTFT